MTPERIEEIKPYFTNKQLDELSREYRTMPTDGEGYAIEPEYEGMAARGNIVKLVSDVKTARAALEEAQGDIITLKQKVELYEEALETYKDNRAAMKAQLAEAQQTIDRLSKFPRQVNNDGGWTLDYKFLETLQKMTYESSEYDSSMEQIEVVLLSAEKLAALGGNKEAVES